MNYFKYFGFFVSALLVLAKTSRGAIGDNCSGDPAVCSSNHEACTSDTCQCADWYYDKDSLGTCVAVIGDRTCTTVDDCGVTTTNAQCATSVCACAADYDINGNNECVRDCGTPTIDDATVGVTGLTVFMSAASVECITGFTLTGNALITCYADGQWKPSTSCDIVDCGSPTAPPHVVVDISGGTEYDNVATFSCNVGYSPDDTETTTKCQADASWSILTHACTIKDCGDPTGTVAQGTATATATKYLDTADIECNAGYEVEGPGTITCGADEAWGTESTCEKIDCGDPTGTVAQGTATATATKYLDTADIECNAGYEVEGPGTITCGADEAWGTESTCEKIDCGSPTAPPNVVVDISGGTEYDNVATFSCNVGYSPDDTETTTKCQADASWSILTHACTIKDCGDPTGTVAQGTATATATKYLDTADIECNAGYEVEGPGTITCGADEAWGTESTCEKIDCGDPTGTVAQGTATATATKYLDTADIECNAGYEVEGPGTITCGADEAWGTESTCEKIDCGSPTAPPNAVVDISGGTEYDNVATFSCNVGYSPDDTETTTKCQDDASWSILTHACTIKDCGDPTGTVAQGTATATATKYLDTADIECNAGYEVEGPGTITCGADEAWGTESTCEKIDCGDPTGTVAQGTATATATKYLDTADIECNAGYEVEGPGTITCGADEAWGTESTCEKIDCGSPTAPPNVVVDISGGTEYDNVATFSCNVGYSPDDTETTTKCQADASWSILTHACTIKDCGDPTGNVAQGTATATATKYLDTADIECNAGYEVEGPGTITCGADEAWGTESTCEKIDCGDPTDTVAQATATATATKYLDTADIECNSGYEVDGPGTITCGADEAWGTESTCEKIDCGDPTDTVAQGTATATATKYLDTADIECNAGYEVAGPGTITCGADEAWGTESTCEKIDCGDPTGNVAQGTATATATKYLDTADIECNAGYEVEGPGTITCGADEAWGTESTCEKIDCGDPTDTVAQGTATATVTKYLDTADIECNAGYEVEGPGTITCGADEAWGTESTCEKIDCGDPTDTVAQGTATATATKYLDTADIECNAGYEVEGPGTITCGADEAWGTESTCEKIDCGDPTDTVAQGTATATATKYLDTADIECNAGYEVEGPGTITCGADEAWGTESTCEKIVCSDPSVSHGEATPDSTTTEFGDTANVTCNAGYALQGSGTITCLATGQWSTGSSCTKKNCGNPDMSDGSVELDGDSTLFEDTATVLCDQGYGLSGEGNTITCEANGLWSTLSCKIECGEAPTPAHGTVAVEGGTVGSTVEGGTATQTCDTGYERTGTAQITCQDTGEWTDDITCTIKDCEDPEAPNNSNDVTLKIDGLTTYGAKATVSCNLGLQCNGGIQNCTITCQPTGWSPAICSGSARVAISWMTVLLVIIVSLIANH